MFPKHDSVPKKSRKKPEAVIGPSVKVVVSGPDSPGHITPSMQHDINHVAGLSGVEESLDWIAKGISGLTSDGFSLSTGYQANPVKVTLTGNDVDETMDRLVTAMERIADAVAKLAGLNRPRLESWHEQDEYEPRYKDIAVDGS